MRFERIVVPLDTSPLAEAALALAQALCPAGGTIWLVSVVDFVGEGAFSPAHTSLGYLVPATAHEFDAYLDGIAARMRATGWHVETEVREGRAAREIVAAAHAFDADLIVMGSHGRGGLRRALLGSVADHVLRSAKIPVAIVDPREAWSDVGSGLRRIMVPLDGSLTAEAALEPAVALAEQTAAGLALVRVEPSVLALHAGGWVVPDFTVDRHRVLDEARRYLHTVRGRLPARITVDQAVLTGDVATALIDYAAMEGVDLVAMTSHGRGGLRRSVLGSVAGELVRAGVPALIIPATAVEAGSLEREQPVAVD